MIRYAVEHGRPDWSAFWSEIPYSEYQAIKALRRIEPVGPDKEDWRSACIAVAIIQANSTQQLTAEAIEAVYAMVQCRKPDEDVITPQQAMEMVRRGNVR
ncbi:MAG: hypothetical protein KDA75_04045 [Planctomycetaceae bacterium]|nr:hypothetical protein [Planctomycetaceae bacterium]